MLKKLFLFITLFALIGGLAFKTNPAHAQDSKAKTIKYGETVNGTVTNDEWGVTYYFVGLEGDVVTITMTRKSGNLKPLFGVIDTLKKGKDSVIAASTLSSDGKTATLEEFTIPKAGIYAIVASRQGVDKGTTSGKFALALEGTTSSTDSGNSGSNDNSGDQSGDQTAATPTPKADNSGDNSGSNSGSDNGDALDLGGSDASGGQDATQEPGNNTDNGNNNSGNDNTATEPQSFEVGNMPSYSVWNGKNLFVANYGDGSVSVLDADGNVKRTIKTGGAPFSLAWDGKLLWVADVGSNDKPGNTVQLFDANGKKSGSFEVGDFPYSMSYDADDGQMWIAVFGENKVVAVDSKGNVQATIETKTNPNTVLWAGGKLWVTLGGTTDKPGNTVIAADNSGNVLGTYKVGKSPADLAWDDNGKTLFVANYDDNSVTALDENGKNVGTYKVGKGPAALSWDGSNLWVSLATDKAVVSVDSSGQVVNTFKMDKSPNGVTSGDAYIWVSVEGNSEQPGNTVVRIATGESNGATNSGN